MRFLRLTSRTTPTVTLSNSLLSTASKFLSSSSVNPIITCTKNSQNLNPNNLNNTQKVKPTKKEQLDVTKMIKNSNLSMDFSFLRRHNTWIQTSFKPHPRTDKNPKYHIYTQSVIIESIKRETEREKSTSQGVWQRYFQEYVQAWHKWRQAPESYHRQKHCEAAHRSYSFFLCFLFLFASVGSLSIRDQTL